MSASTRSNAVSGRVRGQLANQVGNPTPVVAALLFAACCIAFPRPALAAAPPLPAMVTALAPDLRLLGGGEMRMLGWSVYDGWYWADTREFSTAQPFALDLHYHRALDGARIAERSVAEIEKLGYGTPAERSRWAAAMKAIFPSVDKGDRLTGVNLPTLGARFFHNGRPIGDVADPSFARAFFGIWLDPRTSRPDFRARLLGLVDGTR